MYTGELNTTYSVDSTEAVESVNKTVAAGYPITKPRSLDHLINDSFSNIPTNIDDVDTPVEMVEFLIEVIKNMEVLSEREYLDACASVFKNMHTGNLPAAMETACRREGEYKRTQGLHEILVRVKEDKIRGKP